MFPTWQKKLQSIYQGCELELENSKKLGYFSELELEKIKSQNSNLNSNKNRLSSQPCYSIF